MQGRGCVAQLQCRLTENKMKLMVGEDFGEINDKTSYDHLTKVVR
jgi:hypothetical protein